MIRWSCHFCGKGLRAPDDSAGMKARCTRCGVLQDIVKPEEGAAATDALQGKTVLEWLQAWDPELGRLGLDRAPDAIKTLGARAVPALGKALGDRNWYIRMRAAEALREIAPVELKAALKTRPGAELPARLATGVLALVRTFPTGRVKLHKLALQVLAMTGVKAGAVIGRLVKALADPVPQVRRAAAQALEATGLFAESAIPFLKEVRQDKYEQVRSAARRAVRRIRRMVEKRARKPKK